MFADESLLCCTNQIFFDTLLTTNIIIISKIARSTQQITHQLSSKCSGDTNPSNSLTTPVIGSKMVNDTLNASFNVIVCTRKSKMVVIAIMIVLNHILNELYADISKPNRRLVTIKMPPIESIVDFIFIQGYRVGIGGGQHEVK